MTLKQIASLGRELAKFLALFTSCFRSRPGFALLQVYVQGLLSNVQRKNIEAIALDATLDAALASGKVAAVGLDVLEDEPAPDLSRPIFQRPNVLLTPHTAGYGPYLDDRRLDILLDNCRRFAAGEPLRNVVDKGAWF